MKSPNKIPHYLEGCTTPRERVRSLSKEERLWLWNFQREWLGWSPAAGCESVLGEDGVRERRADIKRLSRQVDCVSENEWWSYLRNPSQSE